MYLIALTIVAYGVAAYAVDRATNRAAEREATAQAVAVATITAARRQYQHDVLTSLRWTVPTCHTPSLSSPIPTSGGTR